jgi:pimeloyl-ACP methyl ester carboxylesterase
MTLKQSKLTLLYKSIFAIGIAYVLLTGGIYLFKDKIVFQADKLDENYEFKFDQPFSEVTIFTSRSDELNALIFNPIDIDAKGTIIYFHGNADNMQRWGNYAVDFTSLGYTVLMIDFSGYGKSSGSPSEKVLYQNAEDTWQWALHHLPSKNFIIYGRSLGTAVAAQLATKHKPQQLILETPFYQFVQDRLKILFPFGLEYTFPNYQYLEKVDCPISIFQGTEDKIVTLKSAEKLRPLLEDDDNFVIIEGGGHKNLRDYEKYHTELSRILQ